MKKSVKTVLIVCVLCFLFLLGISVFFYTQCKGESFRAEIVSIKSNTILVNSLESSESTYTSLYDLHIDENTKLCEKSESLTLSDLSAGDKILVRFDGVVAEIYPGRITVVYEIKRIEKA